MICWAHLFSFTLLFFLEAVKIKMQIIYLSLCVYVCVAYSFYPGLCHWWRLSVNLPGEAALKELPCPFYWVGFPRHLSLWRDAWSMCSIKVLVNKILFNSVGPITFFSHVNPLKGSILLGTEEIVPVKAVVQHLVPGGSCSFSCFSVGSGLHTWAAPWWRLPRGASGQEGRTLRYNQEWGSWPCVWKWDVFCFGSGL